jgi:hypothetical protein
MCSLALLPALDLCSNSRCVTLQCKHSSVTPCTPVFIRHCSPVLLMSSTDGSSDEMPMLITAVGDDAAGSRLIQHCKDAGVRMEHVKVRLLRSSTLCAFTVLCYWAVSC